MEVVAVSVSEPTWQDIHGTPTFTSIVRKPSSTGAIEIIADGIATNKTAAHDGPVYAYFAHHYEYWCRELKVSREEWDWCHWGENITFKCDTTDFNEASFQLGDEWSVGDNVRLQVCGARVPCNKLSWRCGQKDMWLKPLADSGFCGVYFRVLSCGTVRIGDRAQLLKKFDQAIDCASITKLGFSAGNLTTRNTMNLLLEDPHLLNMLQSIFSRKVSMIDDELLLKKNTWKGFRKFKPFRIVAEGNNIKSFYLKPVDGDVLATYLPGQFLSVRVPTGEIRNWSISDWPSHENPGYYRLTIKRQTDVSLWMYENCTLDTSLEICSPAGRFHLDWSPMWLARQVYLSAGIGITPILSMLKAHYAHVIMHKKAPAIWLHVCRNSEDFAFRHEIVHFPKSLQRMICFTDPLPCDILGQDYDLTGRPNFDTIRRLIKPSYTIDPLNVSDHTLPGHISTFYICGSSGFESLIKKYLQDLEVPDMLVRSESFTSNNIAHESEIEMATIRFSKSGVKKTWKKDKNLTMLEIAEAAGLAPEYGCRVGACGSCKTKLKCGTVTGGLQPDGDVYVCVARPASVEVELEM